MQEKGKLAWDDSGDLKISTKLELSFTRFNIVYGFINFHPNKINKKCTDMQ